MGTVKHLSSHRESLPVQSTAEERFDSEEHGWRDHLDRRLDRIESKLQMLVEQRTDKDWYATDEVAQLLG